MIFNLFLPSLMHLNSKFLSSPLSYSSSFWTAISKIRGFPGGSDSKESSFNAGDLGSIPGFGRPSGGWRGYPLQYSWASLVTQTVKNPPAMWETWLGRCPGGGHGNLLQYSCLENPYGHRSLAGYHP